MRGSHRRCAGAFLLSGSLAFGCLEDADNPPIFPATNGGAGLGGTAAGGAGASGTANGGAPTGGRRNVAGAETGGTGPSGNAGEGRGGGDSGEGGAAGAAAPAIVNCVAKAEVAQDTYTDSLYADCRVEGVVRSTGPRLIEFYQQVFNWTKRFWGCEASGEELEFELVFEANALTQADVDLLIELYVEACDRALVLSAADEAEMRARLARIAEPVVVNPSENTYSMSLCQAGTGGVGGAGGAGVGGAGGSPEIGGAGGATAGGDGGRQSL